MAYLDELQLKQSIKNGDFYNSYLIYGEESYLKQQYVKMLKDKLVNDAFESFNYHYFEGNDIDIDDVLKDAQMLPMMSEYSVVIVKDYPSDMLRKDMKAVKEYFEDVNDCCVLIFWFDAVEPDQKSSSFKSLAKLFEKSGACVDLKRRSETDVAKILCNGAKKRGSSIDSKTARYLISIVGNDMKMLLNELDKLSYYAQGTQITNEIIDSMATKCLAARIYDLSKYIVSNNSEKAYSVLDTLFALKEEPIVILATIGGVYVDMYRVKCAKTANYTYLEVGKHFNYAGRDFALKNAARDCADLTEAQLRKSLDEISSVDSKMKSTAVDKKLLLEELIIKLILIAKEQSYA